MYDILGILGLQVNIFSASASVDLDLILQNVFSPKVLFFFLGSVAVFVKSDLEIPAPLPKLFSLYLLLSVGFRGGVSLAEYGLGGKVLPTIGVSILMALIVPLICFCVLRLRMDVFNAAAISASYGSISAVTFIAAESFLQSQNISYDGFMVAPLALMESPAIIVGLILVRLGSSQARPASDRMNWNKVLHESMLNGYVYLIAGSLFIGFISSIFSPAGVEKMEPFVYKFFYGALCFFLLDMGIVAAQRIKDLRSVGSFLVFFSVLMPMFNACLGVFVARALGLGYGNALLFVILCSSASYIAVPTAMRMTVPEANPKYYISTALGLTFPFNHTIGIPLYMGLVFQVIPSAS